MKKRTCICDTNNDQCTDGLECSEQEKHQISEMGVNDRQSEQRFAYISVRRVRYQRRPTAFYFVIHSHSVSHIDEWELAFFTGTLFVVPDYLLGEYIMVLKTSWGIFNLLTFVLVCN